MINKMIGKENICHVTMLQLAERFSASDLTDKILNTETEVEKDIIKNIEMFKKLVTGDELAVEEKYKPRYIIKPMAKFIYGTNNLPKLEGIDDEGYYRRLYILPFEKHITKEEENKFDRNSILNPEALDYLANIVLRAYLKVMDTRILANKEESDSIILEYRETSNSARVFLKDEFAIREVFGSNNTIPKTAMYAKYISWCHDNNFFIKKKKDFYQEVLRNKEYIECTGSRWI